ncbi:MAG: hypothetical protein M3460_27315 [Actinomycetota bacterium]|nr:hypothetical protein [Actinomycetota bacterium]
MLAGRILAANGEIDDLVQRITNTITLHCPTLQTRRGVGPDNAAALLIAAGDNPDRLRAVWPQPPGSILEARPAVAAWNRGGDRQANSALYRITLSRLRWDARTRDYLAREIYQIITFPPEAEPSAA